MIRLSRCTWGCACGLLLGAACQDGSEGNHAPAEMAEWTVEQVVRIGSLDDPEQALTTVRGVRIGPGNRLFIAQPAENLIRVYDRAGALVQTIGRSGEGPGEFLRLGSIGFVGDTLHVGDDQLGRVSVFSADGEFLNSLRWTTEEVQVVGGVFLRTAPQVFLDDGGGLVQPRLAVPVGPDGSAASSEMQVPFVRIDRSGEVTDTLGWRHTRFNPPVSAMVDGTEIGFWSPFDELPRFELMPDGRGLLVIDEDSKRELSHFRVTLVDPAGDTTWSQVHEYAPLPMTDGAVRRAVGEVHESLERRPPPHPTPEQVERSLRAEGLIPEAFVPVSSVAGGQDGSIWIRREATSEERIRWDVWSPEGEHVARVYLPDHARVVTANAQAVVTRELDELDVPYVVWYDIQR